MRRRAIVRALHDLILAKGYAETSLSDLAETVGMSVSHLLYYFDSKEAVLEELCRKVNARFLAGISASGDDSPERRLEALVDQIFTGRGRPRQEYQLTAEMVALSVNRPKIRKLIAEFNDEWSATLTVVVSADLASLWNISRGRGCAHTCGVVWTGEQCPIRCAPGSQTRAPLVQARTVGHPWCQDPAAA